MSELISCVEIHTCMHAFICLILCVARSSVVTCSLQVINMSKYIQSTFVLVPIIQGIHIGFYVWTLIWCIYLIASSLCCTQHPKLQQRNYTFISFFCCGVTCIMPLFSLARNRGICVLWTHFFKLFLFT